MFSNTKIVPETIDDFKNLDLKEYERVFEAFETDVSTGIHQLRILWINHHYPN